MEFRVKRGWSSNLIIVAIPPIALVTHLMSWWLAPESTGGGTTVPLDGCALMYLFFSLYWFCSTRYEAIGGALVVHGFPATSVIPFERIISVTPTRSIFVQPAWSHDALYIRYEQENHTGVSVTISPADKAGFLQALLENCPQLRLEGDRLRRGERVAPASASGVAG